MDFVVDICKFTIGTQKVLMVFCYILLIGCPEEDLEFTNRPNEDLTDMVCSLPCTQNRSKQILTGISGLS